MGFHINKKAIKPIVLMALGSCLLLAGYANAAAGGWEKTAGNITDFGHALVTAITVLCAAGGVGAIGFAGKLLLKKSGERGDDVEWSKVGYATLAGAFLLSVAFIALTTVETLGGSSNDVGGSIKKIGTTP